MENQIAQIGKNIFVTISEFQGKKYIDVRKYYEEEGEMKPTKKGIAFSVDNWQEFVQKIADIDNQVKEKLA